jgi:Holliday junction resolvase RusA-like endonuclease
MSFVLFIPGQPVPFMRPAQAGGHRYTPPNMRTYKQLVEDHLRLFWAGGQLEYASVRLVFVLERPKRLLTKRANPGRCWCNVKPDGDNLEKLILDAIKNAGILHDDGRIVSCCWLKLYRALDERAGVCVIIDEAGPVPEEWLRLGR